MVEIKSILTGIGISLAWLLIWILVFNRWFFFSPMGLLIVFGIPIAGWVIWWNFYRDDEQKIESDGRLALGKSKEILLKLKESLPKLKKSLFKSTVTLPQAPPKREK